MKLRKKRKLGFGFSDEVAKVNFKSGSFKNPVDEEGWKDQLIPNFDAKLSDSSYKSFWGVTVFLCLTIVLFFAIFLRLFHLQIVHGKANKELADGNRIKVKVIHAPRGVIFDRNGTVLAANSPGFRLIDPTSKKVKFISREEALELEVSNDPKLQQMEVDNIRKYPQGEMFGHVLGYVGEISEDELKALSQKGYVSGDRIGKSGIESQYEEILRGKDGGEIIEVDSQGRQLRTLRREPPIPGNNIYLTIDALLQEQVFNNLKTTLEKSKKCCAAAIASDPSTGQVLTLVSFPSFDPNVFTTGENDSIISDYFTRFDAPLLNRVIGGTYPPGSTYKIVSSLAALASGKVTPNTQIEDTGITRLGAFTFSNWYFGQYGRTEGFVNMVKALQRSNDTYYYHIGQIIGEEPMIEWSRRLLLGGKSQIDLPGEVNGLVPDNEWKVKNFGEQWYPGDTLHMSIGQGFLLTTPIQVLGFTSFVASDGVLYKPQLLLKVERNGREVTHFEPKVLISNITSKEQINIIKQGLEAVPKDGGTAWPFFSFPIPTAGKTGTAEFGDPKDNTHAWYTSYAPVDDPKIVMTVLLEVGGEGSTNASPIVKEVFRWFFSEDKSKLIKDIGNIATESARTLGE